MKNKTRNLRQYRNFHIFQEMMWPKDSHWLILLSNFSICFENGRKTPVLLTS